MVTLELIKELRAKTGVGVVDAKKALTEVGGDIEKAIDHLKKQGLAKALKKSDRETHEGAIASYIHSNSRVGVLVKLVCETDFVSRNESFQALARDIAMHIAAMNPKCTKPADYDQTLVDREKAIWVEQLAAEGKTGDIVEKIMAGKEDKLRRENALLSQMFIKDDSMTVEEYIATKIQVMGENIQVAEFSRVEL